MKKLLGILLSVLVLSGCKYNNRMDQGEYTTSDFAKQCIGGVIYWTRVAGSIGLMAPYVDPDTLTYKRCGEFSNEGL